MNIFSSPLKVITITALASLIMAPIALAGDAPQFSVQSNATPSISSSASAFKRGNFAKSAVYSRHALKQGLKKSRKAAAYNNLCAALGAQAEFEAALSACNSALQIAPQNWHAFSNRAAVNFMSGNQHQARLDMQSAQELAVDAPEITHNIRVFG